MEQSYVWSLFGGSLFGGSGSLPRVTLLFLRGLILVVKILAM